MPNSKTYSQRLRLTQRAAMKAIRPGAIGAEVYEAGLQVVNKSRYTDYMDFLVRGIGLVSHESPRLTNRTRDPYKPEDARCPLESRMVLSVETTLQHPQLGFIKLEDTVEVTEIGHEVYGDRAHGWNRAASKLSPYWLHPGATVYFRNRQARTPTHLVSPQRSGNRRDR